MGNPHTLEDIRNAESMITGHALRGLRLAALAVAGELGLPGDAVAISYVPCDLELSPLGWAWQVSVTYEYRAPRGRRNWHYTTHAVQESLTDAAREAVERVRSDKTRVQP